MSQFLFRLSPVSVSFKMEPQLEDVVVKLASEAPLVAILPLLVDNLEGNILVWRTSHNLQYAEVPRVTSWNQLELGCGTFFNQIRVEYVELVTLDNLGRGIVHVVMGLVVLVPLETSVDPIEVPVIMQYKTIRLALYL